MIPRRLDAWRSRWRYQHRRPGVGLMQVMQTGPGKPPERYDPILAAAAVMVAETLRLACGVCGGEPEVCAEEGHDWAPCPHCGIDVRPSWDTCPTCRGPIGEGAPDVP